VLDSHPQRTDATISSADEGIATFHGAARFVDRDTVAVGCNELKGRSIVCQRGATRTLSIFGRGADNDQHPIHGMGGAAAHPVIGGGYISFEFAQLRETPR
jgi:glutathione reductase (NADPH)